MKVSVILSVFNGERFVRDAVLSILAQTHRDFELVIVDDASTDGTREILEELAAQDTRIRVLTNITNFGLTKSLNVALQHSHADFIARMDADDVALPTRLEKQLAFLHAHPDIDVVGTAYEWIDESGNAIGRPNVITDSVDIARALPRTNPILHSSLMILRSALERAHGYDERYRRAQDYDLWLRLLPTTRFANLPEVLMQKRMAPTMVSFTHEREQLRAAVRARLAAIRRGDILPHAIVYIIKPLLASLLPIGVVRFLRIHLFGQTVYRRIR